MRRFLGTYLTLCALLIGAWQSFAQLPMTHAGKGAPGGGASCAGFTVDGAATSQPATGALTSTQNITTTHTNDIIFSIVQLNGGSVVSSTSDTAGLTWTSPRASTSPSLLYESWALSTGTLSGDTITTHYNNTGTSFIETIVFGVAGTHTAAPFDSGGSSNVPQTGTNSPVSININATNSFALGFARDSGSPAPQSGWTQIAAAAGFTLAEIRWFTSQQTGLSVSDATSGSFNGIIGDALVCGP